MKHLQQNERHLADKLQHLPAPDMEQSWEKMRRLLDREMPEAAGAAWSGNSKWWWMGITAGVIMLALWLSQQFNQPKTDTAVAVQTQAEKKATNKNVINNNTPNENTTNNTKTNAAAQTEPKISPQTTSSTGSIAAVNNGDGDGTTGTASSSNNTTKSIEQPRPDYNRTPVTAYLDEVANDVRKDKNIPLPKAKGNQSAVMNGESRVNDNTAGNTEITQNSRGNSTKSATAGANTVNNGADVRSTVTAHNDDEKTLRHSNYENMYVDITATATDAFNTIENTEPNSRIIAGKTDKAFVREMRKKSMKADDRRISRSSMRGNFGDKERDITFAAGLTLPQSVAISGQHASPYNVNAKNSRVTDYLPAPFFQYHINPKLFVQTEFHFQSPQYTQQLLLSKTEHSFGNTTRTSTVHLEKLYYFNIPFNIYYSPVRNMYIGGGLQYSSLQGGVARFEYKELNGQTQVAYNSRMQRFTDDSSAAAFTPSEWRYQFDANYNINRFSFGLRYNRSMKDFINIPSAQGRNTSFLLYLRFNIWEERRKD